MNLFQHTAARRRLPTYRQINAARFCFNTQPPEGGWRTSRLRQQTDRVSTHSRPKAADLTYQTLILLPCFNTQPPEGGCVWLSRSAKTKWFQHTAARRRLQNRWLPQARFSVSTHSRPKAAGLRNPLQTAWRICFNTQPPEGGWSMVGVSGIEKLFQHTAARRRLFFWSKEWRSYTQFQHTAARRRLGGCFDYRNAALVSTHSRPKAADQKQVSRLNSIKVSTHSRPKAAVRLPKQKLGS